MSKVGLVIALLISSTFSSTSAANQPQECFVEEAVVSPLPDGLILVHVQFTQRAAYRRHYTVFPKAVGQLVAALPFDALELSLTQGRWHSSRWGQPLLPDKPAGAELRASFSPVLPASSLPGLWGNLSHALGGLFCASLNFVARPQATAQQAITMKQHAAAGGCSSSSSGSNGGWWAPAAADAHVLHASLPQEASCTENLTPWLKLLPCRDAAGLGQLLHQRDVVFGADYHSMQVIVQVHRDTQQQPLHTTLTQSFTMVLRPPTDGSSGSSGGDWGSNARKPPEPGTLPDVNLEALLGSKLLSACPVARVSRLFVKLPERLQQQQRQWLLHLPAYTNSTSDAAAAAAAVGPDDSSSSSSAAREEASAAAADSGASDINDDIFSKSWGNSSTGRSITVSKHSRAASWSTPAFIISPAPDAAVVLWQQPQQQQQHGSSAHAGHVMYVYDFARSPAVAPAAAASEDDNEQAAAAAAAASGDDYEQAAAASEDDNEQAAAAAPPVPQPPESAAAAAVPQLPFLLQWQRSHAAADPDDMGSTTAAAAATVAAAAVAADAPLLPQFVVSRHISGTGNLHGGMVLHLQAVTPTQPAAAAVDQQQELRQQQQQQHTTVHAADTATAAAGGEDAGFSFSSHSFNMSVCIFQAVPWYIRLWLHTLQLSLDGQLVNLEDSLLLSHVSTAQDRDRPLVLDLCLSVPASTRSITLTAQFSKAFLMMLEHPPDAYRGFDVPSALISFGRAAGLAASSYDSSNTKTSSSSSYHSDDRGSSIGLSGGCAAAATATTDVLRQVAGGNCDASSHSSNGRCVAGGDQDGGSWWQVSVAPGIPHAEQLKAISPLMQRLSQAQPQQMYSPGLVVPLAVPDFSMPYNVVCLTSTVLAVFMGGVLNALLWRPGKVEREAADELVAQQKKRKKVARVAVLVVLFGGLAVYWDEALQAEILKQAQSLGLYSPPAVP